MVSFTVPSLAQNPLLLWYKLIINVEDGNSFCYVSDSIWVKASPEWLGIAGTGSAGLGLHLIFNSFKT